MEDVGREGLDHPRPPPRHCTCAASLVRDSKNGHAPQSIDNEAVQYRQTVERTDSSKYGIWTVLVNRVVMAVKPLNHISISISDTLLMHSRCHTVSTCTSHVDKTVITEYVGDVGAWVPHTRIARVWVHMSSIMLHILVYGSCGNGT